MQARPQHSWHAEPSSRQEGLTLVELVASAGILTLVALSVFFTAGRGMQQNRESFQLYRAMSELRNRIAVIQATANLPQNLAKGEGIGAIYGKFGNKSHEVHDLPHGKVAVSCFADERKVPSIFGGPQDLNFDGDAEDNLANASAGTDLKLIPILLTIKFTDGNAEQEFTMARLITKTTE